MRSSAFVAASAAMILVMGFVHLVYTFGGPKMHPRDAELMAKMKTDAPVVSRETTMWKTWMGFNATHSFGLILFGAMYGYLAIRQGALLFDSCYLLALGFAVLIGYAVIAKQYFFWAPFYGVVSATFLYVVGIAVHLAQAKR